MGPTNPIRATFENHGAKVARHPVLFIVLSVTVSVILSYPSAFLYFNASPGPSSVTHHVWTSATPYNYPGAAPDMGIRQAWVQGSYMEALTHDVLREGLRIQQALLGTESPCQSQPETEESYGNNGFSMNSQILDTKVSISDPMAPGSFFHSPLLYWNCSLSTLETDPDIIGTVNDNISRRSPAKVGLRWGSVFAGKQFSHQKLMAADALVISLFYNLNSSAGALWDQRASKLAQETHRHGRFIMYPSGGQEKGSTLYEVSHHSS